MADIPQHLVDSIMVKCGRRCCVCRRFKPTKLQVHHIVERSNGSADDEDNLMPICLPCHTDVHSKVPFARRFSIAELKAHRDALFRMIDEGRFPADEPDNTAEIKHQVFTKFTANHESGLSSAEIKLLLHAAHGKKHRQGRLYISKSMRGHEIKAGDSGPLCDGQDSRAVAEYTAALNSLIDRKYSVPQSDSVHLLTHLGYLKADEIEAEHGGQNSTE